MTYTFMYSDATFVSVFLAFLIYDGKRHFKKKMQILQSSLKIKMERQNRLKI